MKLAYITNNAARKAMYKKRKMGLIKEVSELRTLCNVDACAIIYSPDDSQPEVYPSPLGAVRVVAKFKNMTEKKHIKKMRDQESFLQQCSAKVNEELENRRKKNREKEITKLLLKGLVAPNSLQDLSLPDLNDVSSLIEQYLKDIDQRMEKLSLGQTQEEDCKPPTVAVQVEAATAAESPSGTQWHP